MPESYTGSYKVGFVGITAFLISILLPNLVLSAAQPQKPQIHKPERSAKEETTVQIKHYLDKARASAVEGDLERTINFLSQAIDNEKSVGSTIFKEDEQKIVEELLMSYLKNAESDYVSGNRARVKQNLGKLVDFCNMYEMPMSDVIVSVEEEWYKILSTDKAPITSNAMSDKTHGIENISKQDQKYSPAGTFGEQHLQQTIPKEKDMAPKTTSVFFKVEFTSGQTKRTEYIEYTLCGRDGTYLDLEAAKRMKQGETIQYIGRDNGSDNDANEQIGFDKGIWPYTSVRILEVVKK